ncbi:DUF167 domain-containing protein [candidate division WOR-3 bacterium]|nr:DUF167 domain-containing protein [candidate division WOR-3 bacterium]
MRLRVRVRAGSKTEGVVRNPDGSLLVSVKARPRDGEANAAVVRVVARFLGLPRTAVRLVAGAGSRHKLLEAG